MKKEKGKKVVVAMSGGVDSSVAAALLKQKGYQVIGLFMKLWAEGENRCCDIDSLESARRVAAELEIPFYVVDFKKEFKKYIVGNYLKEYSSCRTPNPCVLCNRIIKFDLLLAKAKSLGADYLATGHYVRIADGAKRPIGSSSLVRNVQFKQAKRLNNLNKRSDQTNLQLLQGVDSSKDQSYFLWTLMQKQLEHLLFPISDYKKSEVRVMAKKWGLPVYNRQESQGLCFVGKQKASQFLKQNVQARPGPIKDLKGNIIGKHTGLPFYTIGQRTGLPELRSMNNELRIKGKTPPLYVIKLDKKNNALIVGEEKDLYKKELMVSDINWISGEPPVSKKIGARIRYGHPAIPCGVSNLKLKTKNEKLKIVFEKPVRAITPGQSIVFYRGNEVLGGGIIEIKK